MASKAEIQELLRERSADIDVPGACQGSAGLIKVSADTDEVVTRTDTEETDTRMLNDWEDDASLEVYSESEANTSNGDDTVPDIPVAVNDGAAIWPDELASMPEVAVQFIKKELEEKHFVHIPAEIYRGLLMWKGATEQDLDAVESGRVHQETPQDLEPTMYFRKVAFHRMVLDAHGLGSPIPANQQAVTQIDKKEITSDTGAKVFFERSKPRVWSLPPKSYSESTVSSAMAALNTLLLPGVDEHHPQGNLNMESTNVINDQILIRITKEHDSDESPTPEGIHQDGTEISSVTMIGRRGVTSGGESRIWKLESPIGNYSSDSYGCFKHIQSINAPKDFDWKNCILDRTLQAPWETILFNDRLVKHEARGFDGPRPCLRDVIVNFIRKPLSDGSDKMLVGDDVESIL